MINNRTTVCTRKGVKSPFDLGGRARDIKQSNIFALASPLVNRVIELFEDVPSPRKKTRPLENDVGSRT